tara:strand:- start:747 stop:1202 length:456 start_codon:yes stop_codon:yes gene_type:complete
MPKLRVKNKVMLNEESKLANTDELEDNSKKKTIEERIAAVENNPRLNRRIERRYKRVEDKKENAQGNPEKLQKIEKKYGYNYDAAIKSGGSPDETGHWGSIEPNTGMLLKAKHHPSIMKTKKIERILGNKIVNKDGEKYSVPKKQLKINII